MESDGNNDWVRDHIFGVEKDYRLARVAKISLYMNGAGEGNIVFGDGLESLPERQIENGTFDVLVANPPYAVKDFKQHLKLKNNSFELLEKIGDNGSEIETLFVERIAQLLKPKGIAAVVLPSSILSNDSASYTGAREQILQNFLIRAIVQFGSKTFGETGTNTVVLFLEKYNEPPKQKDMVYDSVSSILSGAELEDWKDKEIFERYVAKIDVGQDVYTAFTKQELSFDDIANSEYLNMYLEAFKTDSATIKYQNGKTFKKLSTTEQAKQLAIKFYQYAKNQEFEKLFYFALTYTQQTVIITAPTDNAKQKEFLGYDWSNRKGNEGIKIIKAGGKLYCDTDRRAEGTLSSAVRQSFLGEYSTLTEENKLYSGIVSAMDMLDFSRVGFSKALKTAKLRKIESKYPLVPLGSILKDIVGPITKVDNSQILKAGDIPVVAQNTDSIVCGYIDNIEPITDLPLILFGDHTCCFKYIDFPFVRGADGTQLIKIDENEILLKYLYYILKNS